MRRRKREARERASVIKGYIGETRIGKGEERREREEREREKIRERHY